MTAQNLSSENAVATIKVDMGTALAIDAFKGRNIELPTSFAKSPYLSIPSKGYQFRDDKLRELLAFLVMPCGDALYITGPTGSGKTSLVVEVASRLGWPVQSITAYGRMEMADLIGFTIPVVEDGAASMKFQYGPLAMAMKEGHIFLLNEVDLMDPSELSGLNDVLEGSPLIIAQNGGEIIKPHPKFRVVVTGNSNGSGDMTGNYQGVLQQNLAAMDRYRMMEVEYADADVEMAILTNGASASLTRIRTLLPGMIDVANMIRSAFIGDIANPDAPSLSVTMSTRTLVRWATTTMLFAGCANPMEKALEASLLRRGTPEDKEVILRFAKDVFEEWE